MRLDEIAAPGQPKRWAALVSVPGRRHSIIIVPVSETKKRVQRKVPASHLTSVRNGSRGVSRTLAAGRHPSEGQHGSTDVEFRFRWRQYGKKDNHGAGNSRH